MEIKHKRKQIRLKHYDYAQYGCYFVTICTKDRKHIFGEIENYEMKYKEKLSANRKAILFLRYNDNCLFVPAVKIYDSDNKLILEKELPKTNNLDSFGSLILSNSKLIIKPKRNSCENIKDNYIIIT